MSQPPLLITEFRATNRAVGTEVDALVFTGTGPEVVAALARETGLDGAEVLSTAVPKEVNELLALVK